MTAKEKALDILVNFSGVVYPYMGSSMLTNDIMPEAVISNSKICAELMIKEVLNYISKTIFQGRKGTRINPEYELWKDIQKEIQNITVEELINAKGGKI